MTDGSCVRLRPERANEVWAYEPQDCGTRLCPGPHAAGRAYRIVAVIDEPQVRAEGGEFTRECLALLVDQCLTSDSVLAVLTDLVADRGPPAHIRSDQGAEFTATAVRKWLGRLNVATAYIEKASPWESGYNESFNDKLRDELLNGEVFYTPAEARVLIEAWRRHYNTIRPHNALGNQTPAPDATVPSDGKVPPGP